PSTGPTPPSTVSRDLSEDGVGSRCCATGSDPKFISISDRKIVSTKVDTYQKPPLPVEPRHAWMNSFDI
ncbi:hypothetical protein, partial [Stenotrophomonas sp. S41]|uniref:hypothetical protein n=1 Tax=Stenotrophomonas sp. S41 TaxID=2767464 RepID=UPI001F37F6D7